VRPIRPDDKPLLAEGIRHQSAHTIERAHSIRTTSDDLGRLFTAALCED
jgi:hypothetical protein